MAYGLTEDEIEDRWEKVRQMIADRDSVLWKELGGLPGDSLTLLTHVTAALAMTLKEIIIQNNRRWEEDLTEAGVLLRFLEAGFVPIPITSEHYPPPLRLIPHRARSDGTKWPFQVRVNRSQGLATSSLTLGALKWNSAANSST